MPPKNVATLAESYARAFSPQSFFGLDMVINWISLVILIWIIGLSYLVWKSDSSKHQNRFIGTLLFFEGLKGLWQGTSVVPYSVDFQAAWDVLWIFKIDVFFVAQITAVLLYFLFPIYFKINALKFMYKEKIQKFAWCIPPILGIIIWILIKDTSAFTLENASWLSCSAVGAEPELHVWYGQITAEAQQMQSSVGPCPAVFESLISDQQVALWALSLIGTPVSILALLLIRNSLNKGDLDDDNFLITQTLYRGFMGKVIGSTIFFSTFLVIIPLINGGPAGFVTMIEWRYVDRSFMGNLKYFIFTVNLGLPILAVGFEAMMFVYASTKDTVLGIDQKLKRTFTNTIFTGFGAISFIAASEIMENVLGFGLVGGVVLGVGLFTVRKPVINVIYRFSNNLIPSELSEQESEYLKLYSKSIEDGEVTENERTLLVSLASAYGLSDQRIAEIEEGFLSKANLESE